jgi:hypothetical protein
MQVRVLGRVEVRGDDGAPMVIGQRKLRQLVAVLALAEGPVSSERRIPECVVGADHDDESASSGGAGWQAGT